MFWVHAHESTVMRVEVVYRREGGAAVGFGSSESDSDE
jgi:hypothetical protein